MLRTYIAALACLLCLSSCSLNTFFQRQYYKNNYEAQQLETSPGTAPSQGVVDGVDCYSYENAYCQSASLQMVHSQQGEALSIHHYNWLMGFIYGAYFHKFVGARSFLPSRDPELGFQQAGEFLGYKRHYFVTKKQEEFVDAVKARLSQGTPVRVAINSATLAEVEGFFPHSVLLVGYDQDQVWYYETGGENRHLVDYAGETASWDLMTAAVESLAEGFNYKWTYQLTIFDFEVAEPSPQLFVPDLLATNGASLVGANYGPVYLGSRAYSALADYLKDANIGPKTRGYLASVLRFGAESRADAANFLGSAAAHDFSVAVSALQQSSQAHAAAAQAISDAEMGTATDLLHAVAEHEAAAGQALQAMIAQPAN